MSSLYNKEKNKGKLSENLVVCCTAGEKKLEMLIRSLVKKNYFPIIKKAKIEYEKNKNRPFYIQEEIFKELVRRLNTDYPYVVLVGAPGTGKNTIIETLIKCLVEEDYLEKISQFFEKETIELIKNAKRKIGKNKERNVILVPSFKELNEIEAFVYDSVEEAEKIYFELENLKNELENKYTFFFEKLIEENIDNLKRYTKKDIINFYLNKAQKETEEIVKKYYIKSEDLTHKNWLFSLYNYVKNDIFRKGLSSHLKQLFALYLPKVIELKEELADYNISFKDVVKGRFKENKIKVKDGREFSLYPIFNFVLLFPYGDKMYNVQDILTPNWIDRNKKKVIKIRPESFKNLIKLNVEDYEEELWDVPLHLMISKLTLPINNILYIEEDFHLLLDELRKTGNFVKSFFMSFLNNNTKIENDSFSINIGKHNSILLATDNDNPFLYMDGFLTREERGLRSRIKMINVPKYVDINEKNVKEFLYFIMREAEKAGVEVEDNLLNYFIHLYSKKGKLNVGFRDIGNEVRELFEEIKAKGKNYISIEDLKDIKRRKTDYFFYTDLKASVYLKRKEKEEGLVSGAGVVKLGYGGVYIPIKTTVIPSCGGNVCISNLFTFIDEKSRLIDETALKGLYLIYDYLITYLSNIPAFKEGRIPFKITTYFYGNWENVEGPSATAAIAASIISALSKEKVYKSRFITGTLEIDGRIGGVGGIYEKGCVAKRMKDLENQYKNEKHIEDFCFIFPLDNYEDFVKDVMLDPFDITDIKLYAVTSFEEAYYLLTCKNLKNIDEKNIYKKGKKKLEENLNIIEDLWFKSTNKNEGKRKRKKFIFFK